MLTDKNIKEYRQMIRSGVPAGEVMEMLKSKGYSKDEINLVFKPASYDLRGWLVFFSLVLGLVGFYLFISRPDRPLLILGLASLLFTAYLAEVSRLKRQKKITGAE